MFNYIMQNVRDSIFFSGGSRILSQWITIPSNRTETCAFGASLSPQESICDADPRVMASSGRFPLRGSICRWAGYLWSFVIGVKKFVGNSSVCLMDIYQSKILCSQDPRKIFFKDSNIICKMEKKNQVQFI